MKIPNPKDYPKILHLRDETYKLIFVKGLKDCGETNCVTKTIKIRAGMSNNETFKTYLHEILHLIEFEWPITIKHKTIRKLEKAIFSFLIDNF